MNGSSFFAIYFPIIVLFLFFYISKKNDAVVLKIKNSRKKEKRTMDYQLVKNYEGMNCTIMTYNSSFGDAGVITKVTDGWIEVDTGKKTKLLNLDYISSIEVTKPKEK